MLGVLPAIAAGATSEAEEIRALRAEIRALEQKLLAIELRQAAQEKAATTPAASAPAAARVTVNDKGFTLASADGANSIRLRGLVQLDARHYAHEVAAATDTFVLRRARLISEGTLARDYSFQLVSEFGGSSASIVDANLNVALAPELQFKFGRFKSPLGLEQLQSDSWTFFNERSLASNLVPNRDLGLQAWGKVDAGRLEYALGVFNGAADGASAGSTDSDDGKDVVARVFVTPFAEAKASPWQGLGFGFAASVGRAEGAAGRTGGYRTDGQRTFFAYLPATIADGASWRIAPQFDFRRGAFGLLGEYTVSTVRVRSGSAGPAVELQNAAWQLATGWVLTGETSAAGGIVPRANFSLAGETWGAFEATARWAHLKVDAASFPVFASAAGNAAEADAYGLGLNWYLSKAVVFKIDYYHTTFTTPAMAANPLPSEGVFISRFQIGF